MSEFRYDTTGVWLKGNTHTHSTASDGGKTPEELEAMYRGAGYDFLCLTDHWVASGRQRASRDGFLWIDGIELDGTDRTGSAYHVVCLGTFTGLNRDMGLEDAMAAAREQGGFTILAHPLWMGNSLEDAWRWPFDAVESYNHVCRWLNGKSDGATHWHAMLTRNPGVLGLAVDDTHASKAHPVWGGGWLGVNVAERTPEAILAGIRRGNFYSSCGPEFHAINLDGNVLRLVTSPVATMRLVGPGSLGQRMAATDAGPLTEARFEVPATWAYALVEIEDSAGRRAWTNPLFLP